jgi:tetratricopeptide (TPR) repeat protein
MGDASCVDYYQEALVLSGRIGDVVGKTACRHELAIAYTAIPELRDLAKAYDWVKAAIAECLQADLLRLGKCHKLAGWVLLERIKEQLRNGATPQERASIAEEALGHLSKALDCLPREAVEDLAEARFVMGAIYRLLGQPMTAVDHLRKSLELRQRLPNASAIAEVQLELAIAFAEADQFSNAREYAESAARAYQAGTEQYNVAQVILADASRQIR